MNKQIFWERWCPFLAAVVYVIAGLFSSGFYHPDEHFQVIEYASMKMGWCSPSDLTWEYGACMRPTLHPTICLIIFRLLDVIGVHDPFVLASILHVVAGLVAVGAITLFVRAFRDELPQQYRTAFVLLSYFLWFLPVVNVRFSSESWAGLALLSAVALLCSNVWRSKTALFLGGVFLGIAFVFRAQAGAAILGILLWLVLIRRERVGRLALIVGGAALAVGGGVLLDYWFYGQWVISQLRYFTINLIDGVASQFGTDPWHYYLGEIIARPNPLIGLCILGALILMLRYRPKHPVVWCVVPFLLLHSMIPHKEFRFLFPIVDFVPFMLVFGYALLREHLLPKSSRALRIVLVILLVINMGGLVMTVSKPIREGQIAMASYLSHRYGDQPTDIYYEDGCNPVHFGEGKHALTARFYVNPNIHFVPLTQDMIQSKEEPLKVLLYRGDLEGRKRLEAAGFVEEHRSLPRWIEGLNYFYRIVDARKSLVLFSRPAV